MVVDAGAFRFCTNTRTPSTPTAKLVLDVVDDEDLWRPSCVYVCLCGAQFGWWWWWKLWGVHSLPLLLLALVN